MTCGNLRPMRSKRPACPSTLSATHVKGGRYAASQA